MNNRYKLDEAVLHHLSQCYKLINRMITLTLDLGLDDVNTSIFAGLREDIQRQINLQRPTTLDDLLAIAVSVKTSSAQLDTTTKALIDIIISIRKDVKEPQEKTSQEMVALQDFTLSMISAPRQRTGSGQHTKYRSWWQLLSRHD